MGLAHVRQSLRQRDEVVAPVGPVGGLPDISVISAIHAEIMNAIHRMCKLFGANYAVNRSRVVGDLGPELVREISFSTFVTA